MDKEKAIAWLDKQVEAAKIICERLSDDIINVSSPSTRVIEGVNYQTIQVQGILELARIIGADVFEHERDDEDYPLERYFIYKGYVVFELDRKEGI